MKKLIERFGKKKVYTGIAVLVLLLIVLIIVLSSFGSKPKFNVKANDNVIAELGEELDYSKLFDQKKSDEGVVVKEVKDFDENKLGVQKVQVTFANKDSKTLKKEINITVKDTIKPEFIDFKDEIIIEQNAENVDLKDYFITKDKSEVTITVTGDVNYTKTGKYDIKVKASDSQGNASEEKSCVVIIASKEEVEDGKELTATVKGEVSLSRETSKKVESGDIKINVKKPSQAVADEVKVQETKTESKKENQNASNSDKPLSDNKSETGSTSNVQKPATESSSSYNKPDNSNSSGSTSKPTHTHDWQAVYKTIHHKEQGHNEKYVVKEAWDESVPKYESKYVYVCDSCGYAEDNDTSENEEHFFNHLDDHLLNGTATKGYHSELRKIQVGTETIHHDTEYDTKWVVDKKAWDEKVIDYYKCSCGETKK